MGNLIHKIVFLIGVLFRMITPPLYSFTRLEQYCKKRIEKNPQIYLPRWFLAELYKDYKKFDQAKKEYLEIRKMGKMTPKDALALGEVYFGLEDYKAVIDTISSIIEKYPNHKNANWHLGRSYMKLEEYQKAVLYMERVIESGSNRYEDYWHLGDCYHNIGQFIKAKEAYSHALLLKPESKELKINIDAIEKKMTNKEKRKS
jgi:tetratricopeptide (TPR) repeat protein